ncbi:hypothetical protein C8Q76DRAFT_79537 [Earliella scabrosa]|nr:hypothetical protein C8Q76DRAFT_79537 [Earliella scabrosa]
MPCQFRPRNSSEQLPWPRHQSRCCPLVLIILRVVLVAALWPPRSPRSCRTARLVGIHHMMELLRLLQFYLLHFLRCDMSKSSFPMDIRRRQPVWPWAGASVHSSSDIFYYRNAIRVSK